MPNESFKNAKRLRHVLTFFMAMILFKVRNNGKNAC